MNITKKLFITLTCLTVFLFFLSGVSVVYADDPSSGNNPGAPRQSITDILTGRDTGTKILGDTLFKNVKNDPRVIARDIIFTVLGFLGTLMVCLVLYSGFLWMTASGDNEKVKAAQGHLRSAIIGIIIVMSAWTISIFVLNALKETVKSDVDAVDSSGGSTSATVPSVNVEKICRQACAGKSSSCQAVCVEACREVKPTGSCVCTDNGNGAVGCVKG